MNFIDLETCLLIGDPEKRPFENIQSIDVEELQQNIEKRLKYGVASPSGIRQVFDTTCGDEKAICTDGDSIDITDAAKIYIATIADCFVELLRENAKKSDITAVVSIDSRHTGPAIADIIIRILIYHGVKVKYTFITPITELAVYSREVSDGFIYISASHNPKGYNGLKLGLDDGRLLPGAIANAFISKYQCQLIKKQNTFEMIDKLNNADFDGIGEVYENVSIYRDESRIIYSKFSDMLITGIGDYTKALERKNQLKEEIVKRDIWVGIDYNGGARKDREYLQSWGFNVYELNSRPRIDMVHDLSPVPDACKQAMEALIELQKEGKNIVAFFVYDTDGDRKNIIIPDSEGGAIIPGVQLIFALDVLCSILNAKCYPESKKIAVVVNDATSSLIEQLAEYLDFMVKRVEVGEANVASAGVNLSKQGFCVPIMGEGSNGSVFNLDLLVREPLHTIRTIIDFITKPELTKYLLQKLNLDNVYDDWHSSEKINRLFINIINSLPPSQTTDFFTDEGIRKGIYDLPLELFKDNFDKYFESEVWESIKEEIKRNFDGEPVAEFVNCEGENELRGRGNRITKKGGYKVELYVNTPDNKKRHIGWIWFRASATELGIIRKGISISHWESSSHEAYLVNSMYKYIDGIFSDALNEVEKITLKGNI